MIAQISWWSESSLLKFLHPCYLFIYVYFCKYAIWEIWGWIVLRSSEIGKIFRRLKNSQTTSKTRMLCMRSSLFNSVFITLHGSIMVKCIFFSPLGSWEFCTLILSVIDETLLVTKKIWTHWQFLVLTCAFDVFRNYLYKNLVIFSVADVKCCVVTVLNLPILRHSLLDIYLFFVITKLINRIQK